MGVRCRDGIIACCTSRRWAAVKDVNGISDLQKGGRALFSARIVTIGG
jgi:hypothetical protein